jgi:hypothetical protein
MIRLMLVLIILFGSLLVFRASGLAGVAMFASRDDAGEHQCRPAPRASRRTSCDAVVAQMPMQALFIVWAWTV